MILIGLGANLEGNYGTPEKAIENCIISFPDYGINVLRTSSIWKTAPIPKSDQPWYRNAVCLIKTNHNPEAFIKALNKIEHDFGRVRTVRNAPRVIDLDVLCYNGMIIERENLMLPHPRMHDRAFVLYPLLEVAPQWVHPVLQKSVDDLISVMPEGQEIEKL